MQHPLPSRDIVLLGAGHTNAHVLRMWRMQPLADVRLTVVSDFSTAAYSGMLPGTLAGLYPPPRMTIDLVRLCAAAGARFIQAEVTGLDAGRRELRLKDRPPAPYDLLSIGIGSVSRREDQEAALPLLPIKPMQTLLQRLEQRLAALRGQRKEGRPLRVCIAGGGAGGVELAFCLPPYLKQAWGEAWELTLLESGDSLASGQPPQTGRLAEKLLTGRGVRVRLGAAVRRVHSLGLELADGEELPADVVVWAIGAQPPALLGRLGLPADERGFLLTRPTLQCVADDAVFVVGDAGTIQGQPAPKAGVYAVRQGPVLWRNLARQLRGEPLVEYRPQRGFLSLLATGDRRAILSYRGLALHGAWCWRLKDWIDSRFMDKYQDYAPMPRALLAAPAAAESMRCTGCGGKVGADVLSAVLRKLEIPPSEHVLLGLEAPDDAALVRAPQGRPLACTADLFAAFTDDPYLVGRVAALHAASDLFAMAARPLAALALVGIPPGSPRQQQQLLYELLAGGLHELRRMGATLAGGHTMESPQVTAGFSMFGDPGDAPPRTKGGLRPGDALILTKPLGSGVLLAAHAQARCQAPWYEGLLRCLLDSNQQAGELCREFDVAGATDVTGFGLAGHLLEMLAASDLSARLRLADVPLLAGAGELAAEGVESTLAPANLLRECEMAAADLLRGQGAYRLLFDPQTSGGLLLGVRPDRAPALLQRLADGGAAAAVVGETAPYDPRGPRLTVE